jgi:hypothetical protein
MEDKTYFGMSIERYNCLMEGTGPCIRLSEEEMKEGWHFCDEWDDLLIHPDCDEFYFCSCSHMKKFKTPEREQAYKDRCNKSNEALDKLSDLDEELGLH